MTTPRISIVTPCLNRAAFIDECVQSVLAQDYPDVEHIVIDGGSTDGTLAKLARYSHLRVVSEPDEGLYDALNKGLRMAGGEIIGHLNSDDGYARGAFARISAAFSDPTIDAVYGGADVIEGETLATGRVVRRFSTPAQIALSFANLTFGVPITNARMFRRRVYERVGYNDLRYRIASDRDFLLRVALSNPRAVLLDSVVYLYRMHPGSLTISRDEADISRVRSEYLAIAEQLLADPALPGEARRCCRIWHSRESAAAALHAMRAGRWRAAWNESSRGLSEDPAWPFVLARHVAGALAGALRRS